MTLQAMGAVIPAQTVPGQVINWRAPRPEVITITLVPIVDPSGMQPVLANSAYPFRARLTWGNGGVSSTAVVDYPTVGGTLTVTASSLTVEVSITGVASWGAGQTSMPDVRIGAFMSLGASRPTVTPPTLTLSGGETFGGDPLTTAYRLDSNGGVMPLPLHARAYYIQDNIDPSSFGADQMSWVMECQNRGLPYPEPGALTTTLRVDRQLIQAATKQRIGPSPMTPFPIPPRTTHMALSRVAGYGPPVTLSLQVVYILDLGA